MADPQDRIEPAGVPASPYEFKAFISYRRQDASAVARWLRSKLVSYKPPKLLLESLTAEQRNIVAEHNRYYLDTAHARANEDFWNSNIEPALQRSKYLIVISSPTAFEARTDGTANWVAREIERFHEIHADRGRIMVALAPNAPESRFPGKLAVLSERWDWADFRGYTSALWRWVNPPRAMKLDEEFLKVVAAIFEIPSHLVPILTQEESRRRLRAIRWAVASLLTTAVAFAGLASWAEINRWEAVAQRNVAEQQRQEADRQRDTAEQRRQEAIAQQLRLVASRAVQIAESDPMSGLALALEMTGDGEKVPELPEVIRSLAEPLNENYEVGLIAHEPHFATTVDQAKYDPRTPISAGFDPSGRAVVTLSQDGRVRMWDAATGRALPGFKSSSSNGDDEYRHGVHAFSSTRLVSAFQQGPVDLWDSSNGSHVARLDRLTPSLDSGAKSVQQLVFSTKLQALVALLGDGQIALFDPNTGAFKGEMPSGVSSNEQCSSSALDADGTLLALCTDAANVVIWDIARRARLRSLRHPGVTLVAMSPTGDKLATASADGRFIVWDTKTGQRISTSVLERPKAAEGQHIDQLLFSPDGAQLLVVSGDIAVLYLAALPTVTYQLDDSNVPGATEDGISWRTFAFSPDGRSLVEARPDRLVRLWTFRTRANLRETWSVRRMKGHANRVVDAGFSPDSKRVLSVSLDGTVRLWDPSADTFRTPLLAAPTRDQRVGNATLLTFAEENGVAKFFDWRSATTLEGAAIDRSRLAAARFANYSNSLSDDHQMLAWIDADKNVRLWRTSDRSELASVSFSGIDRPRLMFDAKKEWIAALTDQCDVYFAPTTQTGRATRRPPPKTDQVDSLRCDIGTLAATGRLAAAFSLKQSEKDRNIVYIVDVETGNEVAVLQGDADSIARISMNPGGTWLAGLNDNGAITIWDIGGRKVLRQFEDKAQHSFIAWGPNGQIAVGRQFGATLVWDVSSGKQLATLSGHFFGSDTAAFSSDGSLLVDASGGGNKGAGGPVMVWDIASGQPIQRFPGLKHGVEGVAISRDRTRIIAFTRDPDEAFIARLLVRLDEARTEALKRVSRCLTPEQREALFLPRDPPTWCRDKWPYRS
jgi:WD40 repeat protein